MKSCKLKIISNPTPPKHNAKRRCFDAATVLLDAADKLVKLRYPLDDLTQAIHASLAAVPFDQRDELPLPPAVMQVLCAGVADGLQQGQAPVWAHDGSDFWDAADLQEVTPIELSRFWFSVAAGELVAARQPPYHITPLAKIVK